MVKVRSLESVPFSRYLCLCNVLRICNIRAIPTYRVYRLYDTLDITLSRPLSSNQTSLNTNARMVLYVAHTRVGPTITNFLLMCICINNLCMCASNGAALVTGLAHNYVLNCLQLLFATNSVYSINTHQSLHTIGRPFPSNKGSGLPA